MDLRFFFPPALNVIFSLFSGSLNWKLLVSLLFVQKFSVLQLAFVVLAIMLLPVFLFTSVELPLALNPVRFRAGAFSVALTASFLASIFFPPSLFWPVHLLIVLSSPWHGLFLDVFNLFFQRFYVALQSVPTYTIMIITGNAQASNPAPPQEDVELGLMHQHHQAQLRMQ